jgi:hypothetical protein
VAITLLTISILIQDAEDLYGIVRRLLDAVPSGSYLAISHAAGGRESRAPRVPRSVSLSTGSSLKMKRT